MIGLNHALTGAAIGLLVREPAIVAPIAFASHFALDALPHFGGTPLYKWGNRTFFQIIAIDGIITFLAVATIIFFAPEFALPIVVGVFFAMLPDGLLIHHYTKKSNHWFHRLHLKLQWFEKPIGAIVEAAHLIAVVLLTILLLN